VFDEVQAASPGSPMSIRPVASEETMSIPGWSPVIVFVQVIVAVVIVEVLVAKLASPL
jgi:hypothetical protein